MFGDYPSTTLRILHKIAVLGEVSPAKEGLLLLFVILSSREGSMMRSESNAITSCKTWCPGFWALYGFLVPRNDKRERATRRVAPTHKINDRWIKITGLDTYISCRRLPRQGVCPVTEVSIEGLRKNRGLVDLSPTAVGLLCEPEL